MAGKLRNPPVVIGIRIPRVTWDRLTAKCKICGSRPADLAVEIIEVYLLDEITKAGNAPEVVKPPKEKKPKKEKITAQIEQKDQENE